MTTYVLRRMRASVVPLVVVIFGVFALTHLTGNPANLYLPANATDADRAAFDARNGFDRPVLVQFGDYVTKLLHLDLGTSLRSGEPAGVVVLRAFPYTLSLAVTTMIIAVGVSLVLGSLAAYRPNSLADRTASLTSIGAGSIPDFWFAIMGILVFSIFLGWLPTSGFSSPAAWILPVATLLIRPLGVLTQVVRGAMVSALSAPYVKLARNKGASEMRVVFGHSLQNAAAPALTVAGDITVGLVNGAVVAETIFGWPGIGNLMIDAINGRDFAVVQAAVLLTAVTIFVLNIVVDVAYAVLDPRVRHAVAR